jgi:hypothetical protein
LSLRVASSRWTLPWPPRCTHRIQSVIVIVTIIPTG